MGKNAAKKFWGFVAENSSLPAQSTRPSGLSLKASDYQELIDISPTRIAGFDFDEPLRADLAASKIVDRVWGNGARCVEANYSFVCDNGFQTIDSVIGLPFSTFFPPDEVNFGMVKCWAENNLVLNNFELLETQADGSDTVLLVSLYGIVHDEHVSRLWTVARDITDRRKALNSLQEAERHYRTLVERPDLVLVRVSADGRYLYISPHAGELHGYSVDQLKSIAGLFETLLHPDDYKIHKRILRARELKSTEPVEVQYRARHLDGTYHWYYERQIPKLNDRGEVEFYDCLQLDMQRQKQLEVDLEKARKMETLGSLASGIAHDFNNHLAAILGQIGISLCELDTNHPAYSRLMAAEQAALASAEMIKNLLSLGRKSAPSVFTTLSIQDLVKDTAQLLEHVVPTTISIEVSFAANAPKYALGNAVKLQEVLMNLGVNARDAINGQGKIGFEVGQLTVNENDLVSSPQGLAAGQYVEICVRDTGSGISPENMSHLFEPFFTTKQNGKGTGLGLSMSYSIIKEHKGAILVDSKVDRGTTFKFYIPVSTNAPQNNSTSESSTLPLSKGTGTVLVADDDLLVRAMVVAALTRQGYAVIEAADGEEALAALENNKNKIQLALVDLTMPKVPGRGIINFIAANHPNMPVILTSGYDGAVLEGLDKEVAFLPKPYQIGKLLTLVSNMLDDLKK